MFSSSVILLGSALLLAVLFFATWRFSQRLNNYAFVDVAWALSFAPVAAWYAATGSGWLPRRLIIAGLIATWSLRLGTHLWTRVARHHPQEDARYESLRQRWQKNLPRSFLFFFLAQGALVWLLMLPLFLISQQSSQTFHPLEYIGISIWLLALIGEGTADSQLKRFKSANQKHGNEVCKIGLWRYSRHPNYFFQSLLWWGLFLVALPAPWGWLAICAPLAMLHFLLNVTGIPLTEKLSLQRRGEAYREYQRTTSPFIPWFPKK